MARLQLFRETGCVLHYFQCKRGHILIFSPKFVSNSSIRFLTSVAYCSAVAAAAAVCCDTAVPAAAAVLRGVSDGEIVAVVHWIWFQCFLSLPLKHDRVFMYPLGTPWKSVLLSHFRPRFAYNTSSVITGMRRASARRGEDPLVRGIKFGPRTVVVIF